MTKSEIKAKLESTGEINLLRGSNFSENWRIAFDLYNQSHGDKVSPKCNHCWKKVQGWLLN